MSSHLQGGKLTISAVSLALTFGWNGRNGWNGWNGLAWMIGLNGFIAVCVMYLLISLMFFANYIVVTYH